MNIERLEWLVGSWRAEVDGGEFYETWSQVRGGAMQGYGCFVADEKATFMEFMSIEMDEDFDLVMYMVLGSPSAGVKPPIGFTLEAITERSAFFDNPMNEFPTRIGYTLSGGDLHCVISNNDKQKVFDFKRV